MKYKKQNWVCRDCKNGEKSMANGLRNSRERNREGREY